MSEINCYIPIKLRITGRPSDSQLDQLGDALVRALTARMAFAERVIEDGQGVTFGYDHQPVREAYDPEREEGATDSYLVPSYENRGDKRPIKRSQRGPFYDVDESQLARPQVSVVSEGNDDIVLINGIRAFRVQHAIQGQKVKRASAGPGSYTRLKGKEYSPAPGISVSWRWTIPLTYNHSVRVKSLPGLTAQLRSLFPSVEFAPQVAEAPKVEDLEKRAKLREALREVGRKDLDHPPSPFDDLRSRSSFPSPHDRFPGFIQQWADYDKEQRAETHARFMRQQVERGVSLIDSVSRTHWASRAELEKYIDDYVAAASSDLVKAAQAAKDKKLILDGLKETQVDLMQEDVEEARGEQWAEQQVATIRSLTPTPIPVQIHAAFGEGVVIPTIKSVDFVADFIPYVGAVKALAEGVSGRTISGQIDLYIQTGKGLGESPADLDTIDRLMRLIPLALAGAGMIVRRAPRWIEALSKLRKATQLPEEKLFLLVQDMAKLEGREREIMRALLELRTRRLAALGARGSSINRIIDDRLAVYLRALELSPKGLSPSAVKGLEKFIGASRADLSNEAALSLLNKLGTTQLPNLLEVLGEMEGKSVTNILKSLSDSSASQAREITQFLAESGLSRESLASFSSKRIFENRKALIQAIEDARSSDPKKNPLYDKYKEATEENPLHAEKAGKEYSKAMRKINTDNRPLGSQFGKQDLGSYEDTFLYYNRSGVTEAALAATEENIYLNVNANHAPEVMRFVVHEIVDNSGQFPGILKAKVAGANLVSKRVDNLVIYAVNEDAMKKALERILEYQAAHPHYFQTTTPPMTLRKANGVSIGSRLKESKLSFGQLRAESIRDVLIQTKDIENLSSKEFLEHVLSDLERKGVNRYAPHTNLPQHERISRRDANVGGNSEAPPHSQSGKDTQLRMTGPSGAETPRVILYRGTTYQFIHGGSKNLHDLGNGLYLTFEPGLALRYAQEHRVKVNVDTPGAPGIVIRIETTHEELGRVLDFYNNKVLKDDWEAYLEIFESGRDLKKGLANENYSRFFETWLKNKGMDVSQFDAIIGPEYVRGGSQICVRNKAIAERLIAKAEEWARAREPLGPAYPDPALPIDKKLLDKLKE